MTPDGLQWQEGLTAKGEPLRRLVGPWEPDPGRERAVHKPWATAAMDDEATCGRCGGPNRVWFAPSPLWNAVMRGGSINGTEEFGGIVCPTCFTVLAEERGIAHTWRLDAEVVEVELEVVTPSGRVWNAELNRWDDAP